MDCYEQAYMHFGKHDAARAFPCRIVRVLVSRTSLDKVGCGQWVSGSSAPNCAKQTNCPKSFKNNTQIEYHSSVLAHFRIGSRAASGLSLNRLRAPSRSTTKWYAVYLGQIL